MASKAAASSPGVALSDIKRASSANPGIPPSSLFSFLRAKPGIAGVLLTEFDRYDFVRVESQSFVTWSSLFEPSD